MLLLWLLWLLWLLSFEFFWNLMWVGVLLLQFCLNLGGCFIFKYFYWLFSSYFTELFLIFVLNIFGNFVVFNFNFFIHIFFFFFLFLNALLSGVCGEVENSVSLLLALVNCFWRDEDLFSLSWLIYFALKVY
jgi:hypothetical protein